jgi:uncharacterized membrane protein
MTMVFTTFIKYTLHTVDLQSDNPWDNKAVYMLYTELFTGMIPVITKYTLYTKLFTGMIPVSLNILYTGMIPGITKYTLHWYDTWYH